MSAIESLLGQYPHFRNQPIGPELYVGMGGSATWFVEPSDSAMFVRLLRALLKEKIAFRILGGARTSWSPMS